MSEMTLKASLARDTAKATLAKNLVLARTAVGLKQDELAAGANLSRATIAQIESGESDPRLSTLMDIATALEISPMLLLLDEQDLRALIRVTSQAPNELLRDKLSPEDEVRMLSLLHTGMMKNRLRAAKIGTTAAAAAIAGLSAAGAVGAAIGSALLPGLGTAIGAILGGRAIKTTKPKEPDQDPRPNPPPKI